VESSRGGSAVRSRDDSRVARRWDVIMRAGPRPLVRGYQHVAALAESSRSRSHGHQAHVAEERPRRGTTAETRREISGPVSANGGAVVRTRHWTWRHMSGSCVGTYSSIRCTRTGGIRGRSGSLHERLYASSVVWQELSAGRVVSGAHPLVAEESPEAYRETRGTCRGCSLPTRRGSTTGFERSHATE